MLADDRITYYDFADLYYSSYFLAGFLQNRKSLGYRLAISRSVPGILAEAAVEPVWRDILFSVSLLKVRMKEEEYYICIDGRDSARVPVELGQGYHLPLLERVKYYFKVNYNQQAVDATPELQPHREKIIPVPLFFPLRVGSAALLPRPVPAWGVGWSLPSAWRRVRTLANLVPLDSLVRLREMPKKLDLFFVVSHYGKAEHTEQDEFRYELMTEIRRLRGRTTVTGFTSPAQLPGKFAAYGSRRYHLREYLQTLAQARVGIYVRGAFDCLSFKLGQLFALGMPIAGHRITNNEELFYSLPGIAEQFAFESPKTIAEAAVRLLDDGDRRRELGAGNAALFDRYFRPEAAAADIWQVLATGRRERVVPAA